MNSEQPNQGFGSRQAEFTPASNGPYVRAGRSIRNMIGGPFAGWRFYIRSLQLARPERGHLAFAFLLYIGLLGISVVPPCLTRILLDRIIPQKDAHLLNVLLLVVVAAFWLELTLSVSQQLLYVTLSERIQFRIRSLFLCHLGELPIRFLDRFRSGNLSYRLMSDTGAVAPAVTTMVVDFGLYLASFVVIGPILFYLDARMALMCLVLVPVYVGILFLVHGPMRELSERLRREGESVSGDVIEFLAGSRVTRSHGIQKREQQRLIFRFDRLRRYSIHSSLLGRIASTASNGLSAFWVFFVLWYGGHQVIQGNITAGGLIAFLWLLLNLLPALSGISATLLGLQDTMVATRRVYEILDVPPDTIEPVGDTQPLDVKGRIEFQGVGFEYVPGNRVLDKLTFCVEPGERVALVGRNGAGKTTAASLLARFYDPVEGAVLLDGVDIRRLPVASLRSAMGVVLQQDFLFSRSIYENITCGREGVPRERVLEVARVAQVDEFAERMPAGYDTVVGERGTRLSGGERQRIAIARALLLDPRILILDEALSEVDVDADALIRRAILEAMADRTTLVIAHRLSTIRSVDRILVMEKGTIIEQGRHEDLVSRGGFYAHLWEHIVRK